MTSSTGSILSGSVQQHYSEYTFVSNGLTYTYTGDFTVNYESGLLSGTVSSSGSYSGITVTDASGAVVAQYNGDAIPVDFGSQQTGLLGTVGGLLGLVGELLNGPGADTVENLHLDATPNLPDIAFAGEDTLMGSTGNDHLYAGGGADFVLGGAGADSLDGGAGVDMLSYSNSRQAVIVDLSTGLGQRGDAEGDHFANFENVSGTAYRDNLTGDGGANLLLGNAGDDYLAGNGGADTLNGGAGADDMRGGAGDDTYIVDNAGDRITEASGAGIDQVNAYINFTAGANVENVRLYGTALEATGNSLANTLIGNDLNNTLDGGAGADVMRGGKGNDTYVVDSVNDVVSEISNEGTDTVLSGVTYTLRSNIENITLTGNATTAATGNESDNAITGNDSANYLYGKLGADVLTGNGGMDNFVFDTALGSNNVDTITDFTAPDDTMRLDDAVFAGMNRGFITADQFHVGAAAADAADRIIYNSSTGALSFDQDGSGETYGAVQFAKLDPGLDLTNKDFLIF